jgi:hypothetical protein
MRRMKIYILNILNALNAYKNRNSSSIFLLEISDFNFCVLIYDSLFIGRKYESSKVISVKNALAGNRTRAARVADEYSIITLNHQCFHGLCFGFG